jgi:virginiamycin B lyase
MTTQGKFSQFTLPTAKSNLQGITAGPDGALWFTEGNYNDKIGRITPQGKVTEFAIPTSGSFAAGITTGPDGAIWFTEDEGNQIGRVKLPVPS